MDLYARQRSEFDEAHFMASKANRSEDPAAK